MPWLNFLTYASRIHWTSDVKCRRCFRWLYLRMQQTSVDKEASTAPPGHKNTQQVCLLFFSKSWESNYQHFTYSSDYHLIVKHFWFASTTFPWMSGRIWPKSTKLFLPKFHQISLTPSAPVCVWKNKYSRHICGYTKMMFSNVKSSVRFPAAHSRER